MREEVRSSGTVEPLRPRRARSPSPPATPAASSAGASSPVVHANVGSNDWLGQGLKAGSQSCVGPLQKASLSATGVVSALGSAHVLCRPWDRGDLLRRLATFNASSWPVRAKLIIRTNLLLLGHLLFTHDPTLEWFFIGGRRGTLLAWDVSTERPNMIGIMQVGSQPITCISWTPTLRGLYFQYAGWIPANHMHFLDSYATSSCDCFKRWRSSGLETTSVD